MKKSLTKKADKVYNEKVKESSSVYDSISLIIITAFLLGQRNSY